MVLAFVVAGLIVLSAVSLASDRSLVTGPAAPVSGVSTSDSTLESYSFQLSNEINPVSPAFWGLSSTPNHIYGPSTTNNGPSFIQNISQTPIVYQRYPSGDIGEETNLTTGQIYNPSSATPGKSSESISNISTFISQCESLSCRAIIELPLEIESPSTGAYEVSYIENVLGFHPTYWELGNEPSGWTCTGVPWSDWSSSTCGQSDDGAPGHTAFAQLTQSYIAAIRAVDSSAQFVCSGGTGGSSGTADDAWISAVMQANGANCAGIAIHVRPASHGNTSKDYTPAGFLGQLQNFEYNLPGMYQAAAATIASACPNCASTKVFVTEFGSADSNEKSQYGQYVGTWPDIVFQAAQVSQGLSLSAYNLDYFQWYDNGSDSMWTPPTTTGGGTTLMYELWKSVFGQLGTYVVNTTLNGTDGVYSVATTDSNSNSADQTWSLLLVNAQVGVSAEVNLQGSGFPTANPGFVSVWTSSGFDNTTVGDLESAITLPAESIALVSTTGLDSTPVPFYGAVNSSATGNPIVGASIAPNPGSPVLTNSTGGFYDNQLPDGAYSVTVSAAGFVSQTTSIALSGVPVSENFSLIPVQGVTFSESGLPAGVEWYVNITGGPSLSNLTTPDGGSTVSSTLTPGNYAYTVASGDKRWTPSYVSPLVVKGAVPPVLISFSLYTYTTTFIESGLPAGLTWSVSTDVGTNSTVTDGGSDAVTFQEANGTHSYNISDVSGWHQTSRLYSGSFSVNGAPESFPVSFYQVVYSVTFEETGLPAGQFWSVTFAGSSLTNTTDASNGTLTFAPEPNGSYYYSIQPLGDYHEGTVPYSGWESIQGSNVNVNVTYGSVSYPVSFAETGLPSGTDWSVTLATDPSSVTVTSSPTTIAFAPSMNGTYAYSIKPTAGYHQSNRTYSGTVTINGAPLWVNFTYSPFHYNVAFAESGLPAGTTWSVTVNGDTATGDTATLSPLSFSNGTYSYSVASVPGYKTTATGSFTVSGKSVTIDKTFTSTRYTVKFTESGLPSGTSWSVTLTPSGGTPATESSITTSLTFSEPNGSYVYSVSPVSGYHIKTGSYSGSLTVSGKSPATTALRWAVFDSTVKFTESTLKKGTKWSVTIGSTSKSTTGTSISFSLANGTYAFSVTASGYTESSGLVSPFVLSGTSLSVVVTFAKVSGSSSEGSASLDLSLPLSRLE